MERADKIFVALAMLALIVVLISKGTAARLALAKAGDIGKQPSSVVMLSESLCLKMRGPAYLTSNLPYIRQGDDINPMVTTGRDEATATGAAAV